MSSSIQDPFISVEPKSHRKLGVMIVGLNGNNGSTFAAASIAQGLKWRTPQGLKEFQLLGSISQYGDMPVGYRSDGTVQYESIKASCDLYEPSEIVVGGWDIRNGTVSEAVRAAGVLPIDLQDQLASQLKMIRPYPGVYYPSFIAPSFKNVANHCVPGVRARSLHLERIIQDIKRFKLDHRIDNVIVLYSGSTERMVREQEDVHDTWENLQVYIHEQRDDLAHEPAVSPSMMYACAALLCKCHFLNGAPQNTLVPAIVELAKRQKCYIGGSDFKSGQTKIKSALVDFYLTSGFKIKSITSYNHLGNRDGFNLIPPAQFNSKRITKTDLINSVVKECNSIYGVNNDKKSTQPKDAPEHTVVIKYVAAAGDKKRAFDEYITEVAFGEENILTLINICPDTCLAVGVMIDLVLFTNWISRIRVNRQPLENPTLGMLGLFFKAPHGSSSNRFHLQYQELINIIRRTQGKLPFQVKSCL